MHLRKSHQQCVRFLLVWVLLCVLKLGHGQPQQENYTVEIIPYKGELTGFRGRCMLQDRDGFMWFGSEGGLFRYDGKNFKQFRYDPDNENSISNDGILEMIEDGEEIIWIGTRRGLNRFDRQGETFKRYYSNMHDSTSLIHNRVITLFQDANYMLWIGSMTGISKYDKYSDSFTNYPSADQFLPARGQPDNINAIEQDAKGRLWIHDIHGIFWRFDQTGGSYDKVENTPCTIMTMKLDSKERFWIAGNEGLYLFHTESLAFDRVLFEPGDPNRLENQDVRSMLEDKSGNIWIRTMDGLYKYSPTLELLYHWEHTHAYANTAEYSYMTKNMFEDRNGTIWFYTEEGICTCYEFDSHVNIHRRDLFVTGGIVSDAENSIWFGTTKGLYHFDRTRNAYTHYPLINPEPTTNLWGPEVSELYKDRKGSLWAGTWTEGLFKLTGTHPDSMEIQRYLPVPKDSSSFPGKNVWQIAEDSSGRLWISGIFQNPCYYDQETDRMIHLVPNPSSAERLPPYSIIFHASEGNEIWALGDSSVIVISPPFKKISENAVAPDKIIRYADLVIGGEKRSWMYNIGTMFMDSHGTIWLGPHGYGLLKFVDGTIKSYTSHHGLPSDNISNIIEDNAGHLWLGTTNGISKFDPAAEVFTNYADKHGLPPTRFSASCKRDGELFFGTHAGLVSFYPDSLRNDSTVPPVFITELLINNQSIWSDKFSKQNMSFRDINEIVLAYNQNLLSIEFAALNYVMPEYNQFRYRLAGLEEDWVYSGDRNFTTYSLLGSGRYTFLVSASCNDGVWNPEPATLGITIRPPPWFTWWAYLVYAIIILGIAASLRRWYVNRARLRNALEIERIEKEKVEEMNHMKSRFFANISHEFRTPLTLISGPIEDLMKRRAGKLEISRDLATTIHRNSKKLKGLINQLLDLSKLETGAIRLQVSEGNIEAFAGAIIQSFLSLAESKQITYVYDLPGTNRDVFFDGDKLEKILSNLISNAFKFTPEGGKVKVNLNYLAPSPGKNTAHLGIEVSDTGSGIPGDKLDRIFDRFYQVSDSNTREAEGTGIGLALTKELVTLYRGEIRVESEPGKGSSFRVWLPISKEAFTKEEMVESPSGADLPKDRVRTEPVQEALESLEKTGDLALDVALGRPVLLIVEDHVDLRRYISDKLDSMYRILAAENGKRGLKLALESIPDLIISDVMMPEMDGIEMCKRLRSEEITNHIPVILLTARADRGSKMEGLETGADDYLIKPFDAEELQVRVKNLLNQRVRLREKFRKEFSLDPNKVMASPRDLFLKKLYEIIHIHMAEPEFKIDQLAEELQISRSQVYRKVRAISGYSPNELIRILRLRRAAELFRSGFTHVNQVMLEVGYLHQSYFTKSFRELYNMTPSSYIKQNHR